MERSPASSPTPPSSSPLVGAFGKLPTAGDFVRVGMQNETTRAFEEWLHQGVQAAHEKRGAAWKATFLAGQPYACVFRATLADGRASLLASLLTPSQDSVGRAFPLAAFIPIDTNLALPLLPHVLGTFLDDAATLAARGPELVATELTTALGQLAGLEDRELIRVNYDVWTQTTRLSGMWRDVFATDDVRFPAYALYLLQENAHSLRNRDTSNSPLAFRVPLGTAGVTSASLWLDLVRASLRWATAIPTFFWAFNGREGDLLVQFGRTPPSSLAELWWTDPRSESVTNLVGVYPRSDALSLVSPSIRRCIERPDSTVAELLSALWTS